MTSVNRDSRLPPSILSAGNGWHKRIDKRMDAYFEERCVTRKGYYLFYAIIDVALTGLAYRIGRWPLLVPTFISILCASLHIFMIRLLPTSGSKKRIVGVARMTHYDAENGCHFDHVTPLRRFALLTQQANMALWHGLTIVDIIVPALVSWIFVVVHLFFTFDSMMFLFVFLFARLLISLHQYRNLATFYEVAVKANFDKHVFETGTAHEYATSRANEICNDSLARADAYLRRPKNSAAFVDSRSSTPRQMSRKDSRRATFSGIGLDPAVLPEQPARLGAIIKI